MKEWAQGNKEHLPVHSNALASLDLNAHTHIPSTGFNSDRLSYRSHLERRKEVSSPPIASH
jgi:hypothetical protein